VPAGHHHYKPFSSLVVCRGTWRLTCQKAYLNIGSGLSLRAYIIVDLGFGDAGKGLLTDFLARRLGSGVVVRYNGGAQAGHNVVTPDGRHHTFSQFGSGMFIPGVRTYLSHHVVIHPTALLAEGDILRHKGVQDAFSRLRLSDQTLVITPFHQAANRIREMMRGQNRHGSCGVGVGETVDDALSHPEDRVIAGDLTHPTALHRKLQHIREQKHEQMANLCGTSSLEPLLASEFEIFERNDVIDTWMSSIARVNELGLVVSDSVLEHWLHEAETVVFEGAQGVLLDADAGFHPYTTWSRCTTENAIELITEMAPDSQICRIGVMRCYSVRHGPGPLPTETDGLTSVISEHNTYGKWQGAVRYGWFDAVLARYALKMIGGVDAFSLTHLDVLPRLETWKYCRGYEDFHGPDGIFLNRNISDGILATFIAPRFIPLEQRVRLTQALFRVKPMLETCNSNDLSVIQIIESLIGRPVDIVSRGSSAENVEVLNSIPL
jgi:adenylosuccinate synthase